MLRRAIKLDTYTTFLCKRRFCAYTDRFVFVSFSECREAFALFDRNADGVISFEELSSVMRLLGNNPTEEELSRLMSDLDTDRKHRSTIMIYWIAASPCSILRSSGPVNTVMTT